MLVMSRAQGLLRSCTIPHLFSRPSLRSVSTSGSRSANHLTEEDRTFKVTVGPDGTTCEVVTPGFNCNDLDRKGRVSPWSLQHIFEWGRMLPYYAEKTPQCDGLFDMKKLLQDRLVFIVGAEVKVAKHFMNMKERDLRPLKQLGRIVYFGQSSYQQEQELLCAYTGELLATHLGHFVLVDAKSRRPAKFPDWVVNKYGGAGLTGRHPRAKLDDLPEGGAVHAFNFEVTWSDADSYSHTNHSQYVRFAMNAMEDACRKGFLPGFGQDVATNRFTDMKMIFSGETVPGDRPTALVWQDAKFSHLVNAQIRKDNQPVFQIQMLFEPLV